MAAMGAFGKMKWYIQVAIVAGVCGALLGALWYFMLAAIQDNIVAKQKSLDELQTTVAKALQQKKIYVQMKADSEGLEKQLLDKKKELPLEKETPQIVDSFYSEAKASSVRIVRLNLRPVIEHEVYTEWPWDMEIIGTYNNVGAFLDKIRQLPRIVSVSGLKLATRASEGEKSFTESVGAIYTATTFIYHEEPIASTAPPAKPAK